MLLKPVTTLKALIAGISLAGALSANAASLADIYELALENDAEFKVAQATLAAGRQASTIGRSALLPQVGATASYSKNDADLTSLGNDNGKNDNDTTSYGAEVRQTLFNAAAWEEYKRTKALVNVTEINFGIEEQALILRTAGAYFDSLKAIDDLETAIAEEEALSHSLEQTKQRFEVGLTAITEVHEAQAEYDSAKANRLIQEGALVIAMEALEVLTGQPHRKVAPLKNDFPVSAPVPAARSSWVTMALDTNLELQNAKYRLDAAERNYKKQRGGHLPTLDAQVGYSDSDTSGVRGLSGNDPVTIDNTSQGISAGVTLSLPLFTGMRTSALRQQAAHEQVAAQETVKQTERKVVQDARSLHQRVNTGVATVHARRQAIISSESALEATKAGYDVGTRNLVNVLDAQRKVYSTKRDFLSALYDYVLSGLRLKQAAGTLSVEDITQLDQWLNKEQLVGLSAEE